MISIFLKNDHFRDKTLSWQQWHKGIFPHQKRSTVNPTSTYSYSLSSRNKGNGYIPKTLTRISRCHWLTKNSLSISLYHKNVKHVGLNFVNGLIKKSTKTLISFLFSIHPCPSHTNKWTFNHVQPIPTFKNMHSDPSLSVWTTDRQTDRHICFIWWSCVSNIFRQISVFFSS